MSQWSLNAIELLVFSGDNIPDEMPMVPDCAVGIGKIEEDIAMVRYLACGYRDFKKHPVPVNERLNWEIYVVVEGEMAPVFPGVAPVPLESQYAWVMPPGVSYGWRVGKGAVKRYVIHFTSISDVLRQAMDERGYFGRKLDSAEIDQVDRIYRRLKKHAVSFSPLCTLKVEKAKIDLSILLLTGVKLANKVPVDKVDEQRVETVMTWYREHMSECPTIDAAAAVIHISAGHLRRTFQRACGCGPHDAFTALRLAHAKELLSETSYDLMHIAKRCGFRSDSDFCRVFSKHTGISPHKWRTHINMQEAKGGLSES
jgi:AraC-like DNA-binding protein